MDQLKDLVYRIMRKKMVITRLQSRILGQRPILTKKSAFY